MMEDRGTRMRRRGHPATPVPLVRLAVSTSQRLDLRPCLTHRRSVSHFSAPARKLAARAVYFSTAEELSSAMLASTQHTVAWPRCLSSTSSTGALWMPFLSLSQTFCTRAFHSATYTRRPSFHLDHAASLTYIMEKVRAYRLCYNASSQPKPSTADKLPRR